MEYCSLSSRHPLLSTDLCVLQRACGVFASVTTSSMSSRIGNHRHQSRYSSLRQGERLVYAFTCYSLDPPGEILVYSLLVAPHRRITRLLVARRFPQQKRTFARYSSLPLGETLACFDSSLPLGGLLVPSFSCLAASP
jgi:hypothetical protein